MAITVTSASAAGNVTCPTTSAGDVIVFINMRALNHNEAYPSGFTGYPGAYQYYAGVGFTQAVSYKIADGTEGGTTISNALTSAGAGAQRNFVFVIHDDTGGWAGAMPKGIQIENNAGNPSGITVASSGMSVPGTVFGVYNCTGTVTSRSMTSSDGEVQVGAATTAYVKYKSYTSSPANQTIDTGDNGDNTIFGFWIEKQVQTNGTASITEAADTVSATGRLTTNGTLSKTEAADTVSATGRRTTNGVLAKTEAADTLAATAQRTTHAVASITEAADTATFTGKRTTHGTASITEAADTLVAGIYPNRTGSFAATEQRDTLVAEGYSYVIPGWHVREATDTEAWSVRSGQAEEWTERTKQAETWTRRSAA